MSKNLLLTLIFIVGIGGYFYFVREKPQFDFFSNQIGSRQPSGLTQASFQENFYHLSQNGNSSCSLSFKNSVSSMTDDDRLRGSCCSPMNMHRYSEQVTGLKKYQNIPEIPSDPYDIKAGLAKKLMTYYEMELNSKEQQEYDYAMMNSDEEGPCCCKCWRWYVYGGLGKYLIRNYKFTGEQITEVWNLSDGCGGDNENHHS